MKVKKVVVLGAGGHAAVLIDALRLCADVQLLGACSPGRETSVVGLPVLGDDTILETFDPGEVQLVNGVGGVEASGGREALYASGRARGFAFASVIHPSAILSSAVELGEGVQVMAGAVVQIGTQLGENAIINTRASIDHDCVVGPHVHVAPGATLSGNVTLGRGVHVGVGATLLQGVTVGERCTIGAGTVVLHDLPRAGRYVGVPARALHS